MASYSISITRNDGSSALFEFQPGKITIGQQRGEIATLDPTVADPHAELHFDGRTVTYVDVGSPAGSFLRSGERLSAPTTLQPGGAVRFGGCTLMVQDIRQDAAGPTPPPAPPAPASSVQPSSAPMQPSAPMLGAPDVMAPGAPTQSPTDAFAATDGPPADAGVVDQLMHHLKTGAALYKKHYLNGVLTIGLIMVPAALVNVLLGWIPFVGVIVALLVGLAQLAIVPLSAGAMGRWALATAAGEDLHWKKAWKNALKNPVQEWLNVAVAQIATMLGFILLIVPGLIVGMFALPAYLLEGKEFIGINTRSAELVMKDPGALIGLGLLTLLALFPLMLLVGIVAVVFAFVPVVGGPLGSLLSVTLNVFAAPFIYLLWAQIYYATVRRLEATDPVVTYADKIQSWSAIE